MEDSLEDQQPKPLSRRSFLRLAPLAAAAPIILEEGLKNPEGQPHLDQAKSIAFKISHQLTNRLRQNIQSTTFVDKLPLAAGVALPFVSKPGEEDKKNPPETQIVDSTLGVINLVPPDRPFYTRRGFLAASGTAVGGLFLAGLGMVGNEVLKHFKTFKAEPVKYNPENVFKSSSKTSKPGGGGSGRLSSPPSPTLQPTTIPSEEPTPNPTLTPTATLEPTTTPTKKATSTSTPSPTASPTPEPTVNIQEIADREIGETNLVEFFLGDLIELFKQRRREEASNNPSYQERVIERFLEADTINMLYVGTDETRGRFEPWDFSGEGIGRSDVIMFVSFDIHTFETTAISFPRDLFVQEAAQYLNDLKIKTDINLRNLTDLPKISSIAELPRIDLEIDTFALFKKIVEQATGKPVDGIFQSNIDFMQGHFDLEYYQNAGQVDNPKFTPGIFDALFPTGLPMKVDAVYDSNYPQGYGTETVDIKNGFYRIDGQNVTKYARSRHQDSDFARARRQRQVMISSGLGFFANILTEFGKGETTSLDALTDSLETHQNNSNLYSDLNGPEIVRMIKDKVTELRSTPKGWAVLAALLANTTDEVESLLSNFTSIGLSRENGLLEDVSWRENYYKPFMLKVAGSSTSSAPTRLGNYLNYWDRIRRLVGGAI